MNDDEDKSPSEVIDEEEKENNPVKETQDQLIKEIEKEKKEKEKKEKKEKEEHEKRHGMPDHRSPEEKRRDEIRCRIDLITYEHRFANLNEHLEQELKRSRLRLENDLEDLEFQRKKRKLTHQSEILQAQLELKTKQQKWKKWVDREPDYTLNPVQTDPDNGQTELIISDRIIELTGVITYDTSEHITDRIHYYNNQNNTYPIFIIIDYSPGGSVMAGYRILKAIESSPAPIYVVVKSYAASMAAMITSLAPHSLVYPNAIILHHQISSRGAGNLKQQQEQLEDLNEWWVRLARPFTGKLNLTLNQFIKMMYEHNSDGDWREFGDRAVELNWADQVVHRIRKTGAIKHPDSEPPKFRFFCQDEQNERLLPKLRPHDYYWLHNPNNYYSLAD